MRCSPGCYNDDCPHAKRETTMTEAFDAFDYHEPTENQLTAIDVFRSKAKDFREALDALHGSREKALALTNLEQALMWANKAAVAPERSGTLGAMRVGQAIG
jgi:hypothetical protein